MKNNFLITVLATTFVIILSALYLNFYPGYKPALKLAANPASQVTSTPESKDQTYFLPQLKVSFSLPKGLIPDTQLKDDSSEEDLFWRDNANQQIFISAMSLKSSWQGEISYLNGCSGFQKTSTGYNLKLYNGSAFKVSSKFAQEFKNENIDYLLIETDPNRQPDGMGPWEAPLDGYIAALIKTHNPDYPIINFQIKLSPSFTKESFVKVLSTIKFN